VANGMFHVEHLVNDSVEDYLRILSFLRPERHQKQRLLDASSVPQRGATGTHQTGHRSDRAPVRQRTGAIHDSGRLDAVFHVKHS
jgi:hypothetical protein